MDSPPLWVVVPVKNLPDAKQRLEPVLAPGERRALFRAMLEDVLRAVVASERVAGILVVTRDPEVERLAGRFGASVLVEESSRGHTAASSLGASVLAREGVAGMLQVPGDIPLLVPQELAAIIAAHGDAPAVTIVPSRDERGSNAVACSPPDLLPLRFGDDSFVAHLERARARGVEPQVMRFAGIALDVDTPDDLAAFLQTPSETRAYEYLVESGIAQRLNGGRGRIP